MKMKILLMTRPWNFDKMRFDFQLKKTGKSSILGISAPLGLMYISSYLKSKGHEIKIVDGYFTSIDEILKIIEDYKPKIIGVSGWTAGWKQDKKFITELKKKNPDKYFVYGGPNAIALKEKCLEECKELDSVVLDEGEYALADLCNALDNNKPLKNVKGIVFRVKDKIIINEKADFVNLDKIPFPDRDSIDMHKYVPAVGVYKKLPHATLIGSRGCPYQCTFCHSSRKVRLASVKKVVDEIEECVKKHGIKDILFYDETFTIPKKRIIEICDEILKRKLKFVWSANARVDCLDEEMLKKMKQTGCWRLLFGLESGVQKNLDRIKKGFTIEQVKKAIKMTAKAGMESYAVFMFGIPDETYKEGLQTIKFACSLPLDYAVFAGLSLIPGTEVYNEFKDKVKINFDEITVHTASFVPESMTKEELDKLLKLSYRRFYLRPKYIIKRAFKIRGLTDLKRDMIAFFGLIKETHK